MFAYCGNNPVNTTDYEGTRPIWERNYGSGCIEYTDAGTGNNGSQAPTVKTIIAGATKQEIHEANRRPNTGEPNSEFNAPNGDKRYYNEDGKPMLDYDHDDHNDPSNHPHDEDGGHWHRWENGVRSNNPTPHPIVGAGMVIGGGLLLTLIYADDLTGVGMADNAYADQVIIWIEQGWKAIFGS